MFEDISDLPEDSPLKKVNMEEINSRKIILEDKKNEILEGIKLLLRK